MIKSRQFLYALASLTIIMPAEAQTVGLKVGQVIGNELGQTVNGWNQVGGTHYQQREVQNYVTTERDECCITAFRKGNTYMLALTLPIARNAAGGVEAERIVKLHAVKGTPNENTVECSLLWIMPAITLGTTPDKPVRSIIYDGTDFVEVRWQDSGTYCDWGD